MKIIIKAPISVIEIQGFTNSSNNTLLKYCKKVNKKNYCIAKNLTSQPKSGTLTEYVFNCLPSDGFISRKNFSECIKLDPTKLKSVLIYLRSTGRIEYEPLYARRIHVKKLGGVE